MFFNSSSVEALRFGHASIPGTLFYYAKELDLDMEDIGIMTTIIFALEMSKPLYQTGLKVGQVLQACPALSKQKLSRKLARLDKMQIIKISDSKSFTEKEIYLEPFFIKVESLIIRDHAGLSNKNDDKQADYETIIASYENKIEQLELQLEERGHNGVELLNISDKQYRRVADFIAKKTGNLMSVKMANELKRWLDELAFTPEFLLCMLELCFERQLFNPKDISRIAQDLRSYSINTVEGLELYFKNYVDNEKVSAIRVKQFDPDIITFGNFTGIDMGAEARKNVYYKWRYDWGFSHPMIMKAGEIMCQRTKNGGLEYIDSVLNNWLSKEIRQVEHAEKEIIEFKNRNKTEKQVAINKKKADTNINEYEIFSPSSSLDELKSKV